MSSTDASQRRESRTVSASPSLRDERSPRPEPIASAWRNAWKDGRFRLRCGATVALLACSLTLLGLVLAHIERRPGVVLDDPILALLPPRSFTALTFGIIYVGLVVALAHLARTPQALVRGVQAYAILMLFRCATMMLTPLGPPAGMIILADPFAEHIVHSPVLTKDLFFSGHTSTMFLLFLAARDRVMRAFFFACTVVVAVTVLWQHVHYTIDVIAAPPFAYAAFAIAWWRPKVAASPSS
jgi:hypothetical protein